MMEQAADTGWTTTPHKSKNTLGVSKSRSTVTETGFGTVKSKTNLSNTGSKVYVPMEFNFFPHVFMEWQDFPFHMDLPGINMEGANLVGAHFHSANFAGGNLRNTVWQHCCLGRFNFEDADLEGADFKSSNLFNFGNLIPEGDLHGSFRGANLHNVNFTNSDLTKCDLTGCDLRSANLEKAKLPQNLSGIVITDNQFENLSQPEDKPWKYQYEQISFENAAKMIGLSENQLEFLVISGGVKVRDNKKGRRVTSDFDPDLHHIPIWEIDAARTLLSTQK